MDYTMIRRCDECGSDEDVQECPGCEMAFCGEHRANLVTPEGCPYCAPIEQPEIPALPEAA